MEKDFNNIIKDKLYNYQETAPLEVFENVHDNYPKRTALEAIKYNKAYIITLACVLLSVFGIILLKSTQVEENIVVEQIISDNTKEIKTKDSFGEQNDNIEIKNIESEYHNAISKNEEHFHAKTMKAFDVNIFGVSDTMVCGNSFNISSVKNIDNLILPAGIKIAKNNKEYQLIPSEPGTYFIKYYEEANEEIYVDSLMIEFKKADIPELLLSDNTLCYNEDLLVTINGSNYNDIFWNFDDAHVNKINKNTYKISGLNSGIHNLAVSFIVDRCLIQQEKSVTVSDRFEYSVATKPDYCSASNAEIKITPKNYKPDYYILDNNIINKNGIFTGLNSGIHFLSIKYGNNCNILDTLFIFDSLNLNPYFKSERDLVEKNKYFFRNYTKIDDDGFEKYNDIRFSWKINNVEFSEADNPYYEFKESGKFVVELMATINGACFSTYSENIIISDNELKIPSIFTPNGDGVGDYFEIFSEEKFVYFNVVVTTTQGEKVFESNDVNKSWDGKVYGNNDAPDGHYFYILSAETEKGNKIEQKGIVQIIRR